MDKKKFLPYVSVAIIFVIVSLLYFNPVLSGKKIKQGDIMQYKGMARESTNFRVDHGKDSYWLRNAFSGMPTYQVGAQFPNDFIKYIDKVIRFLPRPADYLFLYFLSFFILLTALKVDWKLAVLGSLSFGFSTYLIIIFGAGHNAKAHAIGYMPMVLAGFIYVYQRRYLFGFILTSIAMALEVVSNHPQMTYYLGFCLFMFLIFEFVDAYMNNEIKLFFKHIVIVFTACFLGLSVNATRLLSTKEYANQSTRSKSELTINPDGSPREKSSGLDKAYITEYSYGISETLNLLIPRFMGGGTVERLDEKSAFYETVKLRAGDQVAKQFSSEVLTYWGKQPIVEAPAYIGAVVFFLFFLGVFLLHGKVKYWLVSATVFSIIMSWGKNFSFITDLFIDYFPLYDKFRAVSSIQVIAELCVPLLGVLALKQFFSVEVSREDKIQALKKALYITGGITLFFAVLGFNLFDFRGLRDVQYQQQLPELIDALITDRKSMLRGDSFRSFMLILFTGGALWAFINKKIKYDLTIVIITCLIVLDLVLIDLNYVNKEDFTNARNVDKPFVANNVDKEILKDKGYYRVANFSGNVLNEARTSYFHNSIGGYHAAKMKRYQELFEYQIAKNNLEVLNMLNTKYFVLGEGKVQENTEANGSQWFIEELKIVESANNEILGLDSLKTKEEAIIRKRDFERLSIDKLVKFERDSTDFIKLIHHNAASLRYKTSAKSIQFAVFSEIYYQKGWNAYLDGKLVPHSRVNYVLRGMLIPKGNHVVEFKFEPKVIAEGNVISLVSYVFMFLISLGGFIIKKRTKSIT